MASHAVSGAGAGSPRPLVSILVPAFNAERWLPDTIRSVLSQSWSPLEIIVVDDGSTDGTAEVAASFAPTGVTLLQQSNCGAPAARNRALRASTGDYIQYLDADDLLAPDKIERQVRMLEDSPRGCVAVGGCIYFEDGSDPESGLRTGGYPELNSDDPVQWLLDLWTPGAGWGMVPLHSWLSPRPVTDSAGPWDEAALQDDDGEYFTRVLLASAGVRWEPDGWCYYRKFRGTRSVSTRRDGPSLAGRLRSVEGKAAHMLAHVDAHRRSRAREMLARQFRDVAFDAYPEFVQVWRQAELRARELGGHEMSFYRHSRLGAFIERTLGWKVARRVSRTYQRLRFAGDR